MKKHTVLIMAPDHYSVYQVGRDLVKVLRDRGICHTRMKSWNGHTDVETESIVTRIIPSHYRYFEGLRCDVCFGFPPHLVPLVNMKCSFNRPITEAPDYIEHVEREAAMCKVGEDIDEHNDKLNSLYPKTYIITAGSEESEFFKRMLNYTYGKFPERPPVVYLDTDMFPKVEFIPPKSGKTQACLKYIDERISIDNLDDFWEKFAAWKPKYTLINFNRIGENNMSKEERVYIRQDVDGLAAAFKRVSDAFNKRFPGIKNVIFSGPCTIVLWEDGTKTVVRCNNDVLDPEKGLAMAIAKKALGTNKSGSNYYDIFKKWLPKPEEE